MASSRPAASDYGLPASPPCPFCDGRETELHSPFGSVLSVATYWCRGCRTAFEHIKWDEPARGATPSGDADGGAEGANAPDDPGVPSGAE